jgi:hypothetical protein
MHYSFGRPFGDEAKLEAYDGALLQVLSELTWALGAWTHVVEPNQIDIFARAVLGNLEQIDDAEETRFARQLRSDIRKTEWLDRIHLDLTFLHAVPGAHFDVGTRPYADTASDFSATNSLAKSLGEHHEESLHAAGKAPRSGMCER